MAAELTIASRFNGPPSSGNGGYTAGVLASLFAESGSRAVQVTLRQPPPLEVPLRIELDDGASLSYDDGPVAQAAPVDDTIPPVEPVPLDLAEQAMTSYLGLVSHPFPTCFVCGPHRIEGDGLRIFPGRVAQRRVASAWTPHASLSDGDEVGTAVTWAALDCVGGWSSDIDQRPMVLGRITAVVQERPRVGRPHVVVGAWDSTEGRKTHTRSTLYDADGHVVARAAHTWIEVDPSTFGRPGGAGR